MAISTNGTYASNGVNGTTYTNGTTHTNGNTHVNGFITSRESSKHETASPSTPYLQEPVAVVSMACRLPDECHTPNAFWKFLEQGKIAINTPPATRYSLNTHYDGSLKPQTMASPGGMFLQGVDVRDIDAQFFRLSGIEATSMDPQQRQLLEVVYEGLENGGVTLEQLDGAPVGCFVSSFAVDYGDIQARDPENRASATVVGVGRAMLSNRLSHFLNIKGPSMTIDTACSGALIGIDLAMKYLQSREITSAIVAGANLYCSPEHVMDHYMGANGAASLSGKCHVFDEKADGYIKAEAVNMVYLKLLSEAIKDKDPIRAVIRGTATNSDGWTAGIASPNSAAQAAAIRQAYKNAGITDLSETSYVECHGTGTRAGDSLEVNGIASVFTEYQAPDRPLRIGSVKGNIGHSEPAAGLSGLLKTILSLEKGLIPGNPTFVNPSPKIDFEKLRLWTSKTATPWPKVALRRASINCFGYGGSNAHIIVDEPKNVGAHHKSSYLNEDSDDFFAEDDVKRPYLLAFSANDKKSLESQFSALDSHLSNPAISIKLRDLAYTLGERRSRHYHRGFLIADSTELDLQSLESGHINEFPPKLGFVFTGQGAQWPEMGKSLLETFPLAADTIRYLDQVLQNSHDPPSWTLYDELVSPRSAEHLRSPELSQPLVTALQLAILAIFDAAEVSCHAVVGHSSGEIAAAVAANLLTPEQAIQVAYYRGKATAGITYESPVGMMAAGLGAEAVQPFIDGTSVQIACYNSPKGVTLSGNKIELANVEQELKAAGHFARLLQVDAAYHSRHMSPAADKYGELLSHYVDWKARPDQSELSPTMFSSTIGKTLSDAPGPDYWIRNMISPVLFSQATHQMITEEAGVDYLIEIGPSGALSGPINQIKKAASSSVEYTTAWKRGDGALTALLEAAGKLFTAGYPIRLAPFNADEELDAPVFISDLPNYSWNHSIKYWHESESSVDWRYRKFLHHDLLGSKILGTPWTSPIWKNVLRVNEVTWLKDHRLDDSIIFPAAAFVAMAVEAIYQKSKATGKIAWEKNVNEVTYRLRNVAFPRALALEENVGTKILLSLQPCASTRESWHEFVISTIAKDGSETFEEHCRGLVSIGDEEKKAASEQDMSPLVHAEPGSIWYKAMRYVGYHFGPAFQPCLQVESKANARHCRAQIKLTTPESRYPQSKYAMHPCSIDGSLQIATVALNRGHHSAIDTLLPPAMMDNLTIYPQSGTGTGIVASEAMYGGVGRPGDNKRYVSDIRTLTEDTHEVVFHLQGLRYHAMKAGVDRPHAFTQVVWGEDVDFLTPNQIAEVLKAESLEAEEPTLSRLAKIVSLVAHKRPSAKLLEVVTEKGTANGSIWIDQLRDRAGPIAKGCAYSISTPAHDISLQVREKYSSENNIEYLVHGEGENGLFGSDEKYDLIILRVDHVSESLNQVIDAARAFMTEKSHLVVVQEQGLEVDQDAIHVEAPISVISSTKFNIVPDIATSGPLSLKYIGSAKPMESEILGADKRIQLIHFDENHQSTDMHRDCLNIRGWDVVEQYLPVDGVPDKSTVLVVDEMFAPVLSNLQDDQFTALRTLFEKECRVLWVTMGSQMKVTRPELSLMFGAARSLTAEYPNSLFMCLDVESNRSFAGFEAIHSALLHLSTRENLVKEDSEFVERDGMFYINRVIADDSVNKAERESEQGAEMTDTIIRGHKSHIRLVSDRAGTLDTLKYREIADLPPISDDEVEVDVHAAGMNFKDLANAMGFVPANEHLFGLECAGIVTEIGSQVSNVKPGDRVLLLRRDGGCLANRVRGRWLAAHALPDDVSFVDAAAAGIAYQTAIYGLIELANLKNGQSVLIHSASGGVGLAAIELCKHLGAEIYATVGTEEKRDFLAENYGIARDRMFSSRSPAFGPELMAATNGRGVDVCLNSLTGDMLHESWRCIAENGNLIEIGKKDLIERNSLSMEPFNRNCSYRAFDLSRQSIKDDVTLHMVGIMMDLLKKKQINPLHVCKVFPFEETTEAFRYIQRGKHIGKVVVSFEESDKIKIPVRPVTPDFELRSDGSYLIAGGFKGLCGSLAVYLARNGAKNIVVISRSGYSDERSQKTIYDCNSLGCHVDTVIGNITNLEDVRRAFQSASKPVIGVIQGAMVLRDKMFTTMTPQEFREPVSPKFEGTWNLHKVSLEQEQKLDFFTLLSSISGLVGQLGQANYAAGNVFLDSFAAYRLQQGLPACSINLGPVEEVGYLNDKDTLSRIFEARGWIPINAALLHRILRASIMQQTHNTNPTSTGQLITAILPGKPPFDPVHRFSSLRPAAGSVSSADGAGGSSNSAKLAILKNAGKKDVDPGTLLAAGIELINGVLMRSLGVTDPLEATRPLANYGVDSLVAVELRNWVRAEFNVEMSALDIVGARTLTMLVETILKKLTG